MKIKKCKHCGSEFQYKRKDTVFCSKSCKNSRWFIDNKDKKDEYDRQRRLNNPELFVEYTRNFRKRNPNKRYEYDKKMLDNSPKLKMYKSIMTQIKKCFKLSQSGKNSKYIKSLGYSVDELKDHLIITIPIGYGWNDYIDGKLQLDHIKPHSMFDYSSFDCSSFKECWSINNLQLLPKEVNHKKGNKYEN